MKITALLTTLLFSATLTSACGDNAYRCVTKDGSVSQDWELSKKCAKNVGANDDCWCSHWAEYYIDPWGKQIDEFKKCCEDHDAHWREC
ncbi:hypothetical protein QBC34DRAFT_382824 [Podospora aff. communis PSN243]|uniref:Extracellular membrane protein CFEM domain-containing protein n=1 Tax=Podospora aff. communis PSN243 TaxID=3040156 RepID=A0AAV9GID7_9PEZI|nr:hypothetical protein QBC34DRAFT_382824 [Podospora aff. communis PSN243]